MLRLAFFRLSGHKIQMRGGTGQDRVDKFHYEFHIFFLKVFAHFGLTALAGPAVVTVPVLSALLLGCGCGVYAVLSRIPGVRRWLV